MKKILLVLIIFIFFLNSCTIFKFINHYASSGDVAKGELRGDVYRKKGVKYKIGFLSRNWKSVEVKGGDLTFINNDLDSTITIDSTCNEKDYNYSLNVLTEVLLIGVKNKELLSTKDVVVDNEPGLKSKYTGEVESAVVEICVIVFKKDNCIFDFTHIANPDGYEESINYFEKFVSQFAVISGS